MKYQKSRFLPISKKEMEAYGWDSVDVVLITGDAYVDHPSFGTALIGRVLESKGYRIGIIAMPDWRNPESISIFGKPKLFFGVTSGAADSMIANYTAFKRRRNDDPYTLGGKAGNRPDRAIIVYCNLIKQIYKDVVIVIGGIEASTRRIAHYDFWSNKVRRSIIEDSRADILVYGMAEIQILEIAERLRMDKSLEGIQGTVMIYGKRPEKSLDLPPENDAIEDKSSFLKLYSKFYKNQHKIMTQEIGSRYLVHNPPLEINTSKLDSFYELPYTREPHPSYKESIPAFEMIKNSITCHRGCFSGCSFCSLSVHQGKKIVSRSGRSIIKEAKRISNKKYFRGHINDIGGPSANMYGFECIKNWKCGRISCTFPLLCKNLRFGTTRWLKLLEKTSNTGLIKKVSIGSGIRYDLIMKDPDHINLLKKLIKSHISGQLKIAPEHTSENVLKAMRKTPLFELNEFVSIFRKINKELQKKQYLIPYLMSCHPGSTNENMIKLKKDILRIFNFFPNQVQAFIPLPMTISSVIHYTGIDPLTNKKFMIIQDMNQRKRQHKIIQNKSHIKTDGQKNNFS